MEKWENFWPQRGGLEVQGLNGMSAEVAESQGGGDVGCGSVARIWVVWAALQSGGKTAALHIGGVMRFGAIVFMLIMAGAGRAQQRTPLLGEKDVARLADELSGETAKRNLEGLARLHRQRGSAGFHAAAELVAERARAYGLKDVAILQFPADGKIFYGTQRSRSGWDAEVGELTVIPGVPRICNKEKIENGKIVFNTDCGEVIVEK